MKRNPSSHTPASLEKRLILRGYTLDELDQDNPYTQWERDPDVYKTPEQQAMEDAGMSEKDFS